jgi:hypothetical protein
MINMALIDVAHPHREAECRSVDTCRNTDENLAARCRPDARP